MMMPIIEMMLSDCPAFGSTRCISESATSAPMMASGTQNITISGSRNDP